MIQKIAEIILKTIGWGIALFCLPFIGLFMLYD